MSERGAGPRPSGDRAGHRRPVRPAAHGTRHRRTGPGLLVVSCVVLAGCNACAHPAVGEVDTAADAAAAATEYACERHEVVLVTAPRPSVLTGFLLDGALADLAVLHVDVDDERRLRLHAFADGAWAPALDATLSPAVSFVDVAAIGGRDRLIAYEPGRLTWFDPESGTQRDLVAVTAGFEPPRRGEVPHVDVTRDLNADGRDDLVVPAAHGFLVFVQAGDGEFAAPVRIGPPTDLAGIYGAGGYRYDPWSVSRVHEVDHDRDGRADLVYWDDDQFAVHLQDERGQFAPEAVSFTTEVAFDSDDVYSLAAGEMAGRVLRSLDDLNGDGVADMVLVSLMGTKVSDKRSVYEIHFGAPTPDGGTEFSPDVGIAFRSEDRLQIGLDRHDFDGDGRVDLMFTTIALDAVRGSLWKDLKGFMGDDIHLQLEFHRNDGGTFSDTPDFVRTIALDGVPSHREPGSVPLDLVLRGPTHERRRTEEIWPRAFNSPLLVGDLTGDGLLDLVIGGHPRWIGVWAGVPGPGLFTPEPHSIEGDVPNDAEYLWLSDLDRDGKQDILMHHPFTARDGHGTPLRPPGTEPHRVSLLISR